MVLKVGDTVIVFVRELDVVVEVLRGFLLFILLEFVSDKGVEGLAVDSQSTK